MKRFVFLLLAMFLASCSHTASFDQPIQLKAPPKKLTVRLDEKLLKLEERSSGFGNIPGKYDVARALGYVIEHGPSAVVRVSYVSSEIGHVENPGAWLTSPV